MAKILKKIIGKSLKTALIISMTVGMITPAHANLIFTNDLFYNEAETFRIGEGDDASATSIGLEFGSTNSETLSWSSANSQFEISGDVSLSNNEIKDVVIDNQSSAPLTPNPGQIYYDSTQNNAYLWDGTAWGDITAGATGADDLDDVYDNDTDKQMDVDNASGLTFDLTATGDLVIEDAGTAYATFTNTGEFQIDNLQMDANTISSTDVNGDITLDPNGTGEINLSANTDLLQNQLINVAIDNQASAPVTPVAGQIYHNTTDGNSYIWDGTAWEDITSAGGDDLDSVYYADSDKIMDVDNVAGLEFESTVTGNINFDLQSTGDFIIQDAGVTYATFTDTGELQIDNLQMDANTLSSTNVNGNITIDPNGNGFVNLGANVNVDGETVILDYDNTGGSITLQFGQTLAETFKWNSAGSSFDFSDDVAIYDTLLVENTKPADSFRVNDEASDTTPFVIDTYGQVGIGTATPGFNFHLYDTGSITATEWQVFDDGTNQVSILTGTQDPTSVATNADVGSIFLNSDTGVLYIKKDDGSTINWGEGGLPSDLLDALLGTYGTPSITNKFVTDEDPRLSATSGAFGETALGTHLDYPATNATVQNNYIYYTRIFLPSDTTVSDFAIFTTQGKSGNVNYGIYSDSLGAPGTKLAEVGSTASTSPIQGFWLLSLGTPLDITTAGIYWIAYAATVEPKAHQYLGAEDVFIPFRVESKSSGSAVLPATANPDAIGSSYALPYLAAFE